MRAKVLAERMDMIAPCYSIVSITFRPGKPRIFSIIGVTMKPSLGSLVRSSVPSAVWIVRSKLSSLSFPVRRAALSARPAE